jgi:hypothetical protein
MEYLYGFIGVVFVIGFAAFMTWYEQHPKNN